jgi:hypothetical protein
MRAQYIAIWKLLGANTLQSETGSLELARLNNPTFVATLVADPEPFFQHIDQSAAIGSQLLSGILGFGRTGTSEERIAAEIESLQARRAGQSKQHVFLVLEGETSVPAPNFGQRKDTDGFAVCFDAVDKSQLRKSFLPSIQAVLASISLGLSANADRQIEQVGEVIYLVEPSSEKPIYTFSVQMGSAKLSIASPLSELIVADTAKRIPALITDKTLTRTTSLLAASLSRETDALQAFIAAWSALEIFVNATFKATYESQWFDIIEDSAPAAAKPVFQRFKEVMSDKYRLSDKFLIIASVLDPSAATTDSGEFRSLKSVRDKLLHALETPTHLPTEVVQKLLLKFMALHVDRRRTDR